MNQRVLDYFDTSFSERVAEGWTHVTHPEDLPRTLQTWQQALETGSPYENELRLRRAADESYRWHLTRALPMRDRRGEIVKWFGSNTDIEDRKIAEEAQRFLVDAGATLRQLARLPHHAGGARQDGCAADRGLGARGRRRGRKAAHLAVAHVDERKIELALELGRRYPRIPTPLMARRSSCAPVRCELMTEISEERLSELAVDDLHLELVRELGFQSYMGVPLAAARAHVWE